MKKTFLLLGFLFCLGIINSQEIDKVSGRFIEVTGSAEMEIQPDEIHLIIQIKEYWEEEFEKRSEFKDYETKVPLAEIEKSILKNLSNLGIQKEDIIIREVGNYWRYHGKEFLFSKQLELVLYGFKKVDEITSTINTKGIDYMRIGTLKNKDITEYRKQVKVEALKAAKEKAEYLLNSIDEEIGDIISIEEINKDINNDNYFRRPQSVISNTIMDTPDNSGDDNVRKIKLRYEIKAKFEIK